MENIDLYPNNSLEELDELDKEKDEDETEEDLDSFGEKESIGGDEDDDEVEMDYFDDRDDF